MKVDRPIAHAPTTVDECRALRAWAENLPSSPAPRATRVEIAKHLSYLEATLPTRKQDDEGAAKRASVFVKLLGGYTDDALSFMSRTICERDEWFPTPKRCLDVLKTYRPPQSERVVALTQCSKFDEERFDQWKSLIRTGDATQAQIDEVPDRWRRIGVELGHLRRIDDGQIVLRRPKAE